MALGQAIAQTAPLYNLALAIVAVILFLKLFSYEERRFAFIKPWKILFTGFILFIVETVMTILRNLGAIKFHPVVFVLFEMIIIALFIYTLLLQKQFVKTGKRE
jgi:ABC-type transport system involved in cytochrome c biogenesis permease subunit